MLFRATETRHHHLLLFFPARQSTRE
jgi:hypothetical protein